MSCAYLGVGPDDEPRLRDEHAFVERKLGEAITQAEAGDWRGFEIAWDAFLRALEQHFQYEESFLFPAFLKSGAGARKEAERLRREHAELRRQVELLDGEVGQPGRLIERLRPLLLALRKHREQEETLFYPWLAALEPQQLTEGTLTADSDHAAKEEPTPWQNPRHDRGRAAPEEATPWQNPARHEPGIARSSR